MINVALSPVQQGDRALWMEPSTVLLSQSKISNSFNIYMFSQPSEKLSQFESHWSLLKLVLNTDKSKLMSFANTSESVANLPSILTSQGKEIELVTSCKYLGSLIHNELSFPLWSPSSS